MLHKCHCQPRTAVRHLEHYEPFARLSHMYGILNINKPAGKTSRDVVNRVQRLIRPTKVGHAGTLDPIATGVLAVCAGPATRLIQYLQQLPKQYVGTFLLGHSSESDDVEGPVTQVADAPIPTIQQIFKALPQFIGVVQQRPPIFSAIKVKGQRSYHLARTGQEVKLEARPVEIHDISVVRYDYPELVLGIACGSGTYIRSIGRDLAEAVGTTAVMSQLVRTAIGGLTVESALAFDDLSLDSMQNNLFAPAIAIQHLPRLVLTDAEVVQLGNGLTIERPLHGLTGDIAGFDATGELIAILNPRTPDSMRPIANLAVASKFAR